MKTLLIIVLALHVLAEGVVGVMLTFFPAVIAPDADFLNAPTIFNYGCAAIAMALVVFWFWPYRHNAPIVGLVLGILATFHTAQVVAGVRIASIGGGVEVIVAHSVFALAFWFLWLRRRALVSE